MWLAAASGVILGWGLDQFGMRVEGGAVAVLGFAPLYLSIERRLFPGLFFGPLTFMYMYHAMGYGFGPLGQIFVLGSLTPSEQGFVPAQWGGVLGLSAFAITFPHIFQVSSHAIQRRWHHPPPTNRDRQWRGFAVFIMLAGVATMVYGLASGTANQLGGEGDAGILGSSLVSAFFAVHQVMFFFLGYLAVRRGRGWFLFWLFMLVGYSIFFFLDGGRGGAVFAAIFSAMGFAWAGTSWRKLVLVGIVAAIGFIPISGIVLTYRNYYRDMSSSVAFRERAAAIASAVEVMKDQSGGVFETISEGFFNGITARFVDQVFLKTPVSIPFAGFQGIENAVWVFVPTIIFPDRPQLNDGNSLAIQYGETTREDSKGWYMPAVGDGYRRGGWPGIALLYVFSSVMFAPVLAICWARRGNVVWMTMLVWLSFQASGIWSATMLSNFWLLWAFSRQLVTFWGLHQLQKFFWAIGESFTGHPGMYRTP